MKNQTNIKVNDVVQFTKDHAWRGCVGTVKEDKGKGRLRRFLIVVTIPQIGPAYVFDTGENIEWIGGVGSVDDQN